MTLALSLLVFAGGAQFIVVAVAAAGGSPLAGLLGGLLLNARLLPYGLAMGGVIGDRWPARLLGAHILIDESVAFSRARGRGSGPGSPTGSAGAWRSRSGTPGPPWVR